MNERQKPQGLEHVRDADRRSDIARKAGQASHATGTAHEFTPEEASEAGKKGGLVTSSKPGHMSEIARKKRKPPRRKGLGYADTSEE